jgi:protein translocase SecG subunit
MEVLKYIFMSIALISGIALIIAVMMQTNKAESFSAAMGGGGGDQGRFRKGSREEMLDRITKYSAIVWIVSCALLAIVWYQLHR